MIKNLKYIVFVLGFICIATNCSTSNRYSYKKSNYGQIVFSPINSLTVATYNIFSLGNIANKYKQTKGSYTHDTIPQRIQNNAQVLAKRNLDLISIQEVAASKGGEWALKDLTHELNTKYKKRYKWLHSNPIGLGFGFLESIGFLYDSVKVTSNNKMEIIPSNGGRNFIKCSFKSGNFDFSLIGVHLSWQNNSYRIAEFQKIETILSQPTDYSLDPDIIILGDFNRFGNRQTAVKNIRYTPEKMFCPNIDFWDPQFNKTKQVSTLSIQGKGIPSDDPQLLSTTVSNNHMAYDMVLCSSDVKEEFHTSIEHMKYDINFGVIAFDHPTSPDYIPASQGKNIKYQWSDHRPVWVRFQTNRDTEDHYEPFLKIINQDPR